MIRFFNKINIRFCRTILGLVLVIGILLTLSNEFVFAQNTDDTAVDSTEQGSLTTISGNFWDYIPYIQFNNYLYTGNGENFNNQYTILEYPPDENGRFQIVTLYDDHAVACIYEIRNDGLYELVKINNYEKVEDLRYSSSAQDSSGSLILPTNMTIGYQYTSGFQNDLKRTIRAILPVYQMNGNEYLEVVMIEETGYSDGSTVVYYLAPKYGIISIVRVDSSGTYLLSELSQVYNTRH